MQRYKLETPDGVEVHSLVCDGCPEASPTIVKSPDETTLTLHPGWQMVDDRLLCPACVKVYGPNKGSYEGIEAMFD